MDQRNSSRLIFQRRRAKRTSGGCRYCEAALAFKPIVDRLSRSRTVIRVKTLRNQFVYKAFEYRGRASGRLLAKELQDAGVSRLCITIAFNVPWVIDALT